MENNTIRCIAIDDEPLALDVIAKFCGRMGGVELHTFSDPAECLRAVEELMPDIVFLDIEMENTTGLAIASQLPQGMCFIFTTAYLEYAIEGFNLDAVDYLHKPFSYDRFQTAVGKAIRRLNPSPTTAVAQAAATPAPSESQVATTIVVKQEYSNVSIPLDDIIYIEAVERYSRIYRTGGEVTSSRVLLKDLQAMLPADRFLRVHRSFIVARARIKSYTRQLIHLTDGRTLPVGRLYAPDLIATLTPR